MPALFEEIFEMHNRGLLGERARFFQGRGAWVAPHRDAMASQNQHLANCSRFQLTWERTRNSMQAPPSLAPADGPAPPPPALGANVPPPGDEKTVATPPATPLDFTRLRWALKIKKRWKPSPHHRQQQDQPPTMFFKDVVGSKTLLLLKTDSRLGWTKYRQTCTKPSSPLPLRIGKDKARFKRSVAWLWRTSWRPTALAVVAVLSWGID